jgi:hypothetical protein
MIERRWSQTMRIVYSSLVLCALASACASTTSISPRQPSVLDPASAAQVTNGVREMMGSVARDVTAQGPSAWRRYFADDPSFFMASEGRLVFATPEAARKGIEELEHSIARIELRWGDDLRVEPLTPALAFVAVPWHEVRLDAAGQSVSESGYFTGLVEYGANGWQFRNAHWSVPGTPPRAP